MNTRLPKVIETARESTRLMQSSLVSSRFRRSLTWEPGQVARIGKIHLTETALPTEVWHQDRRTMSMAAGSTSLSRLLVAARELSPSGQNWTDRSGIVLPHYGHDN